MKQNRQKRTISVVLAILLLSVFLCSGIYFYTHLAHACTGHDCQICLQLKNADSMLKVLQTALEAGILLTFIVIRIQKKCKRTPLFITGHSLVNDKVRLND